MSNAGNSDDSASDSPVADILSGNETGSEAGNETGSESGGTEAGSNSANETEAGSPSSEETSRVREQPVSPVGDQRGVTPEAPKKRRGRPPGSRNKNSNSKPTVRTGYDVPCSKEQAESSARVILSMTTPALNSMAALCNRPLLLERETTMQYDAIVEYAMAYGDPLGKYGPMIFLCVAYGSCVTNRIPPPEWTGLDKEVAAEAARKAKEAEKK